MTQNTTRRETSTIDASEPQNMAQRLAALTYEDMLQTKVAFGSGAGLTERLKQLEEELGLDGIVAEMNAGGLIPAEQVMQSMKILTHEVMPAFK